MKINIKLRQLIFWFFDWLKGSKLKKHYKDIQFILNNSNSKEAILRRKMYLEKILLHSTETTDFYSKFRDFKSLDDFPVINKSIIKENSDAILSSLYQKEKLRIVTTSGSTGAPLTVWQDKGKRERHTAENILFSEQAGFPLGSRLYYLRVWNQINRKKLILRLIQNLVMQDADDLSGKNMELFLKILEKDSSPKTLLAFASTFEAISLFLVNKPLPLPVKVNSLITISETLPDGAKEILKKAFNCPVISRYSNMENGFLGQQCIEDNTEYHINIASFHVEILDLEKDEPVDPGKMGRIVITDLFNYAMPLIRYDTGDIAMVAANSSCGKPGPVFTKVEGRKVDFIFDTRGNLLSPHVVTNTMWKYSAQIRQFQFIQNGIKDYVIKLNCLHPNFDKSKELLIDLKNYLGQDADILIEFVEDIPVLASGKRKKIINNYN